MQHQCLATGLLITGKFSLFCFWLTKPFLCASASASHSYTYLLGLFGNNNLAVIVVPRLVGDGGSLSILQACPRVDQLHMTTPIT